MHNSGIFSNSIEWTAMSTRKGITIRISPETAAEIHALAQRNGYGDREFFILGASLAKLALEEQEQGHRLILIAEDGKPLTKIVLPEPQADIEGTVKNILGEPYSLSLERAIADLDPDRPNKKTKKTEAYLPPAP